MTKAKTTQTKPLRRQKAPRKDDTEEFLTGGGRSVTEYLIDGHDADEQDVEHPKK